jgi:hypothetical protein
MTSMILMLSLSLISPVISTNNPCSQCHNSKTETCAFDPTNPQSTLPSKLFMQSSSIQIAVVITGNGNSFFYRIESLQVTLASVQGSVDIRTPQQTLTDHYPGQTPIFQWQVNGVTTGIDTLQFTLCALNSHHNIRISDTYSYSLVVAQGNGSGTPQTAVEPSISSMFFHEKGGSLTLQIKQPITNLQIAVPQEISVQPSFIPSAQAGDNITLSFTSTSKTPVQGMITITWSENSNIQTITLPVGYTHTPEQPVDYYSLTGRATAITLLGLLIASMIMGGASKRINTYVKKRITANQKNELHCLMSWIFFEIALFHGAILLIGPYRGFIWDTNIILGYLSATGFFIIAVEGRFMNPIIHIIGARWWRIIHKYVSWGTLLLVLIHAILIGTEFTILRGAIGI